MKIFSIPMIIYATAYARADSVETAFAMARAAGQKCMYFEMAGRLEVPISGLQYDNPLLPDFSLSPAMTIGGPEEHIENVECVHDDETNDEPAASPLSAAEALDRIRARLAGEWLDPSGDLESDISATLRRVQV